MPPTTLRSVITVSRSIARTGSAISYVADFVRDLEVDDRVDVHDEVVLGGAGCGSDHRFAQVDERPHTVDEQDHHRETGVSA